MATRTLAPSLAAVRADKAACHAAELRLMASVLGWASEHFLDPDPSVLTYGDTPLPLAGVGAPSVSEFAVYDLAAALGMSSDSGMAYLAHALEIRYRLPRLWERVSAGEVQVWRARKIAAKTIPLPSEAALAVDTAMASTAHALSFAQLDRTVDAARAEHDPAEARRRREAAAEKRHVTLFTEQVGFEGTVEMTATLDLADALDLEEAIRRGAKQLADAGSTDSLDVRRSRALGLMARQQFASDVDSDPGRSLTLYAHLSSDVVARLDNTRSALSVDQIREWCQTPGTRVTIKPVIDLHDKVHVGAYEVPDRITERVGLRDHHCVFPYCSRPAAGCDTDHTIPWDAGGQTATDNLVPLCRRHHRAKTHSAWTYTVIEPGTYLWRSPTGLTFVRDHHGTHEP